MTDALTGKIHTLDFDNDKISVLDCFLCWQSEAHMAPGSRTVVLLYLLHDPSTEITTLRRLLFFMLGMDSKMDAPPRSLEKGPDEFLVLPTS